MPELAEVEFNRKRWDPGVGFPIVAVRLHGESRLFRETDGVRIRKALAGAVPRFSEAHGKRMVFRFGGSHWLMIHLGMTGRLSIEPASFAPGRHDHLVLVQSRRSLVFSDPPQGWLFHERWDNRGRCPRHRLPLQRGTVGGRTSVWCSVCQTR